jgi:multiple sugar transport system substrate-binding protein
MSLAAQCGAPATPQVVEKIVTVEVEKQVEKEVEKVVTVEVEKEVEKVVTVEVEKEVQVGSFSSADRAVEEAKKMCAGVNLNVTWEASLQSQDPLTMGPQWEQLTGSKITVVELAYPDLYSKTMQDHMTGGGAYDVVTFSPGWLIDFAAAGVVEPLNPYIDKYLNKADLEDYIPAYGAGYAKIGDTWYGFPDDGDLLVLYYRKDLFEDEANKSEFKAKYGTDLVAPETWEQFQDAGEFFTAKYAPDMYGGAVQRLVAQNFQFWIGPFSGYGGQFFDEETMKPGINSEAGVKALTNVVEQDKWMPPGIENWDFMAVLSAWMDGKLAMVVTWPPIGRWSAGYGTTSKQLEWVPASKVVGKVGYMPQPGPRPGHAGGFTLAVSADSKNKECAYLFIQWMNSPTISLQRVMLPYALRDPFRMSHLTSPLYRSAWPDAPAYLDTLEKGAEVLQMELGIPGAREYMEALEIAITSAIAGEDPQAALDKAAAAWEEITDRLGRDAQREAYKQWRQGPWNKEGPK